MSHSPQKVQAELSYEIEKRISYDSPSKYDIDFYHRKVTRLENDLNETQDQLSKARVRLRRAEDYEIKYDLLLKQNTNLLSDIERLEKENFQMKSKHEVLKVQIDQRYSKGADLSEEKKALRDQLEKWKTKYEELEERKKVQLQKVHEQLESRIKESVSHHKRDFSQKEEHYIQEVRKLKKIIHEKQTVESVVTSRVETVRKDKNQEISRLSELVEKKKIEHAEAIREKNEELDKVRQKFEKMFNFELENLRKNQDDQDEVFSIEINGLREILSLKNDEITNLLSQLKGQTDQHEKERSDLLAEINQLKQKIYSIERENELELYNVKQRLTKIHALEIEAQEKRFNQLVNSLKKQRADLESIMKQKDRLMDNERKDMDRIKDQMTERIKEREGTISQLKDRIKEFGDANAGEMKNLHESFHKIETEKESMTNEYQTNVAFLTQQVAKLQGTIDLKNTEIKQINEELAMNKRHHADSIREMEENWKEQRKEREQERDRERDRREKAQDEQRAKQRQWRNKQRELERERQKQQREKNKLKYVCEQLERDIERLNLYNKNLDESLKREMKKSQMGILDNGGVRRELTAELDRQKSELQAIKRMEVDQIRRKYEVQMTRLVNDNEKLQTDLLNKEIANGELQSQLKKLQHINKNIDRINKEKMLEYQKKMATLNNEINLTQNLYKAFMESKSRQAS